MNDFIFVYITSPGAEEAKKIAKCLLEEKLIACANIYPGVTSLYWWEGKIAEEGECVLIAKTTEGSFEKVKDEIEKIHPYKTPCIVKIPVSSNEKYFDWVKSQLIS